MVNDAKIIVRTSYEAEAFCFVSDNASTMVATGVNISHHMWWSRCHSHIGNLLCKDLLDLDVKCQVSLKFKKLLHHGLFW